MKTVNILKLSASFVVLVYMAGFVSCKDDSREDSHFIYFGTTEPYTRIGSVACNINNLTGEITNQEAFPAGTDLTAMKIWFVTNHGNDGVFVNGKKQQSGATPNDFSGPVEYQIRTKKETRKYTVRFTVSETCRTQTGVKLEGYQDFVASVDRDEDKWLLPSARLSEVEFTSKEVSYKVNESDPAVVIAPRKLRLCLFEVDLTDPSILVRTTLPANGDEWGMQNMVDQAKALESSGRHVLGAINGDYFDWNDENGTGEPEGIVCRDGVHLKETFDDPDTGHFFGIREDGRAAIGNYDQYLVIKDRIRNAIGGREIIISADGRVSGLDKNVATSNRTVAGMSSYDHKTLYMAVVEGLDAGEPSGITLYELAGCMLRLGVGHALNLDGGGSSTFVVREGDDLKALNRPGGILRNVGNGLAIIKSGN